ncbi:MMPL family transporter [Nonomuraea sp. NN258]|nr:MMPL family transporter [Nonomuraea antri]
MTLSRTGRARPPLPARHPGLAWTIGAACARQRGRVLLAWAVLALVALALLPGLLRGLAAPSQTVAGSPSARAAELAATGFPAWGDEQVVVAFAAGELRARRPAYRRAMSAGLAALARAPGISSVRPMPPVDGQDPRHAYALAGLTGDDTERQHRLPAQQAALDDALRQISGGRVTAGLVGVTPVFAEIRRADLADLRRAETIAVPLTLAVLVVGLGTLGAALVPLLIAGVTILGGTAVLAVTGGWMGANTLTLTVVATVGLGLGLDYALLVLLRYRQARQDGAGREQAAATAVGTAGTTVAWCGLAVVMISGCGLAVVRSQLARTLIAPAAVAAVVAVAAALTLLPAVLVAADRWLERGRIPLPRRLPFVSEKTPPVRERERVGGRWARHLTRRPWPYALGVAALLLLCALPATGMRLGVDYDRPAIAGTSAGQGLARMEADGLGSLITVVVPGATPAETALLTRVVRAEPGVSGASALSNGRGLTMVAAFGRVPADAPESAVLLDRLRTRLAALVPDRPVHLGGAAAVAADLLAEGLAPLRQVVVLVLVCTLLFLLVVFRSVLIPVKAVVMNLLAVAAAFGLLALAFDGPVVALLPLLCCTIVFGLSLDYEVFLVHRIAEHYRATGDNAAAVAHGMRNTTRTITLAAAVMTVGFASLMAGHRQEVRQIGFTVAAAIAIDATLVRLVLVPALMRLLGHRNWWMPIPGRRWRPPDRRPTDPGARRPPTRTPPDLPSPPPRPRPPSP